LTTPFAPTPVDHRRSPGISLRLFVFILLALVGGAIVRSAIATRLDGFTIDEAYHIAAGVSSVRNADFRINPEHPPLVKLWVGSLISATGFRLSSIRPITDKEDERNFTEEDVYLNNDFNTVQRRARIAMWTLNGLLLIALAFAVRRTFGPGVSPCRLPSARGCISIAITLGAHLRHDSGPGLIHGFPRHFLAALVGMFLLCILVLICYGRAERLAQVLGKSGTSILMRLILRPRDGQSERKNA
jgi:hypothetical protein